MPSLTEIDQVLHEGREEMAGMFTDVIRITAPGNRTDPLGEMDEETGQYDAEPERVVVYHGPGRMQVKADINSNVVETTAGGREWTYLTGQMQLPALNPVGDGRFVEGNVDDVDVDHVVEWLAAPFSTSLEGTMFNVAGPYHKSQAVYLRFRVREVVA